MPAGAHDGDAGMRTPGHGVGVPAACKRRKVPAFSCSNAGFSMKKNVP